MQIVNVTLEPYDKPKYIVFHGDMGSCSISIPITKDMDLLRLLNFALNGTAEMKVA